MEPRALLAVAPLPVQSFDGSGNNPAHPEWGSTDEQLLRRSSAAYGDGISSPAGADLPNARLVSNLLAASPEGGVTNDRDYTAMAYAWGQFLDHDIGLTDGATPRERLSITVPTGDPWFDPAGTGGMTIPMSRSAWDPATGTSASNPRQQLNRITAFIDGSQVYGSDATRAAALRGFVGGRMKTSAGDLLPFNTTGLANANDAHVVADSQLFLAGDVRANENPELASLQTVFVREHNRIAAAAAVRNPGWSDEQLFQHARRVVIAELQQITYNEFLPALLGANTPASAALRAYRGYRSEVNPGIATEFSTAGFRVGHSMLGSDIQFLDDNGSPVRDEMRLKDAFFDPRPVSEVGIDPLLKYLASDRAQEIDTQAVDDVRNFLFGAPGQGGFDLVALNIQRGRDHGLADYNTVRVAYGLPRVTSFAEITPDASVRQALEQAYGSVDKVDLWVGGLAEKHLPGSSLGATFTRIIVDQFMRLRDGDRYWYQNVLPPAMVRSIQATTLADVIRRNTGLKNLQSDVFMFRTSVGGVVFGDRNGDGVRQSIEPGLAAAVVTLVDSAGATVARTRTDARGAFVFDHLDLGSYRVVVTAAGGGASATSRTLAVTKGGDIRGLDLGLAVAPPPAHRPPAAPRPPVSGPGTQPGTELPRAAFAALAAGLPAAEASTTQAAAPRR
ncbi:MAG: peroxidase family protein [Planctomycetota bacterium]